MNPKNEDERIARKMLVNLCIKIAIENGKDITGRVVEEITNEDVTDINENNA
jgi:hypothetical protein